MTVNHTSVNSPESQFDVVREILVQSLQLDTDIAELTVDTELMGAIPELDSMAVVTILTALEENFGFFIDDSEVSGEIFETLGTLTDFVDGKCAE